MMKLPEKKDSSIPPLLIMALIGGACIVLGGLLFFANRENTRKADEYHARAADYYVANRLDAGLREIDKALSLKKNPPYLQTKLNLLIALDRRHEASLVLDRLIRLEPKEAYHRYESAQFLYAQADLKKAISRLREAIQLAPQNATYRIGLARTLYEVSDREEAIGIFETLVEEDPHYYPAWQNYSAAYEAVGDWDTALEVSRRALDYFSDAAFHRFHLARLYDYAGDESRAVAEYIKSLELQPMSNSAAGKRIYEITGQKVPPELENVLSERIPFEVEDGLMFVQAWINDEKGRFLFDTGASVSVLYREKSDRFNLEPSPFKLQLETINGMSQASLAYGTFMLGQYEADNILFALPTHVLKGTADRMDGIIGMDILKYFRLEIDRASREIILSH